MKIAYLAHRTRPDILLACNFLFTLIEQPTQKSLQDLDRVVEYLSKTRGRGLRYTKVRKPRVLFYTDAAYACHFDAKGHTGVVGGIGEPRRAIMGTSRLYTETKSCVLHISQAKISITLLY